jgi:hypothetical protein
VYVSSQPPGGEASWSKAASGEQAAAALATSLVATAATRYFQVVPEGMAPGAQGVWGVVSPSLASDFHLLSPPLVGDRLFNGAMGAALAAALPEGAQVHLMTPGASPTWQTLELVSGAWRTDPGGALYTTALGAGQGFFVQGGSGATPTFTGPVGNVGTGKVTLAVGYNLLGLSEGRALTVNQAFSSITPVADFDEDAADQVILQNSDGSWRRLMRLPTGVWYDLSTGEASSISLTPGQAYYYIRRTTPTTLDF